MFGFAAFSSLANHCVLPTSSRSTHTYWQDNCLNIWCNSLSLLNSLTNNKKKSFIFYMQLNIWRRFLPRSGFKVQSAPLKGVQTRTLWGGSWDFFCTYAFMHSMFPHLQSISGWDGALPFFLVLIMKLGLVMMLKNENEKCFFRWLLFFVCVTLDFIYFFFPLLSEGWTGDRRGGSCAFAGVLHKSGHQLCPHLYRALLVANLFLRKSLDWF